MNAEAASTAKTELRVVSDATAPPTSDVAMTWKYGPLCLRNNACNSGVRCVVSSLLVSIVMVCVVVPTFVSTALTAMLAGLAAGAGVAVAVGVPFAVAVPVAVTVGVV